MTRYTQYFNKKYKRIGPLYQGRYKAVLVESDEQLVYLTRYIHRNSVDLVKDKRTVLIRTVLKGVLLSQPSSYLVYLGEISQSWVKTDYILQHFSKSGFNSYQTFVESIDSDVQESGLKSISGLSLE